MMVHCKQTTIATLTKDSDRRKLFSGSECNKEQSFFVLLEFSFYVSHSINTYTYDLFSTHNFFIIDYYIHHHKSGDDSIIDVEELAITKEKRKGKIILALLRSFVGLDF